VNGVGPGNAANGDEGDDDPKRRVPKPIHVPETFGYRLKTKLLGPPMYTEQLAHEKLSNTTALAVFASDNLSSSAYATEEILRVLVPVVGVAAFALVVPVTIALLVVLGFLILSYRQTIEAYPSAGGAYVVTKDNFGTVPALVAGVSLLTDYILTVAVSVAAGTAALASAAPALEPFVIPISILFVVIIAYGNLRGVKESGQVFAVPTYFFLLNMFVLLAIGFARLAFGHLPQDPLNAPGLVSIGQKGNGLLMGAALFVVLRAFASGGAAVTGVEAISNGVPAFREPSWKNARKTLVVMGSLLGAMFLGLSVLASKVHAVPYEKGTPTVISQVGKLVFGKGAVGSALFYSLQAGTMLILVLAANTSFADFPRLASFAAADQFMPRQLTKRGQRLVFSNGIISLAVAAIVLILATEAKVDRLIPLYAIGVFTSFTLSQGGMARHHIRLRHPGWRKGLFINGTGAVLSLVVDIIIAVTKFSRGAWVVIVMVPILVLLLLRLHRQYAEEAKELEEDAPRAAAAPILRRHVVFVLIDRLDLAAARAIQYARTLMPDELRAVHFAIDPERAHELHDAWSRLGLSRVALDIVACPDRRIARAAVDMVAEEVADGDTEVTVLLPRIEHSRRWHKLLHDSSADRIAEAMAEVPHANVTFVPFHLGRRVAFTDDSLIPAGESRAVSPTGLPHIPTDAVHPGEVRARQRVTVAGPVYAVRVQPRAGVASLECRIKDPSGEIVLVFLGRRHVAGIEPGALISATGMVASRAGRLEMLNPEYSLLQPPNHD
jgi:amino acid transporter